MLSQSSWMLIEPSKRKLDFDSFCNRWSEFSFGLFLIVVALFLIVFWSSKGFLLWLLIVVFITLGVLFFSGALLKSYVKAPDQKKDTEPLKIGYEDKPKLLIEEYRLSQEMHNYYGRLTWEIASILLGGGFAGLGLVVSTAIGKWPERSPYIVPFALMFIFFSAILYLIVRRYRKITQIHLDRCIAIERLLGLEQHQNVRKFRSWPSGWGLVQALLLGAIFVVLGFLLFIVHSLLIFG